MKKLDKKQVPQFAALCILSSGIFGYFVLRMVTPSPAAASSTARVPAAAHPALAAVSAPAIVGKSAATVTATSPAAALTAAAAPDPALAAPPMGMRDPFAVGYVDPKLRVAPAPSAAPAPPSLPSVSTKMARATLPGLSLPAPTASEGPLGLTGFSIRPTLPAAGSAPTLPAAPALPPAPPAWTVTGVVQTDTEKMAILRNGEARRLVRSGDFVDSTYRVADVSRAWVVLKHGAYTYRLMLGGDKPAVKTVGQSAPSGSPAFGTSPLPLSAPSQFTAPPQSPAPSPSGSSGRPASRPGQPDAAALSHGGRALSRLARLWLRPAPALPAHARPLRSQNQFALRFLDGTETDK